MTVETPQPRDRVRWQRTRAIEGVVEEITSDGLNIRAEDGRLHLCQVEDATVEVLERATCRAREDPDYPPGPRPPKGLFQSLPDGYESWAEFHEKNPYQPPARPSVRVPNEPHGIPEAVRQRVVDAAIAEGKTAAAQELQRHVGIPWRDALDYVGDLPEYQAFLSEHGRTEVDEVEADRMRAMGFDKQPEVQISDEARALIASVLEERMGEYFRDTGYGYRLNTDHLAGVVADIVYAVRVQDRNRAGGA